MNSHKKARTAPAPRWRQTAQRLALPISLAVLAIGVVATILVNQPPAPPPMPGSVSSTSAGPAQAPPSPDSMTNAGLASPQAEGTNEVLRLLTVAMNCCTRATTPAPWRSISRR